MRIALTHDEDSRHYVLTDITPPDYVGKALDMVPELEIADKGIYPAVLNGNHSSGPGLIFTRNLKTTFPESETEKSILTVRVAYGWDVSDSSQRSFWTGKKANRFHISINGERRFFPVDWKEHPHYRENDPNNVENSVAVEEMNVSFRWTKGLFENHWNSFENGINLHRSTYARSNTNYAKRENGTVLKQTGRSPRVVKFPTDFDPNSTIIRGYIPIFNTLKRFGELEAPQTSTNLEKITHEEGLTILFDKVRPCIERYIQF